MKIVCVVLIYFDFDVIKKSLLSLLNLGDNIEFIVVENRSEATEKFIRPFISDLIAQQKVSKYFLFDENISNNALEIVFDGNELDIDSFDFVLLTDGDLECDSEVCIEEEMRILENNPDVWCCGVSLDLGNLPVSTFPDAYKWIPPDIQETESYIEAMTGLHLLLLRTRDYKGFLQYRRMKKLKFVDSVMHNYCYQRLKMKWARTKKISARHLTWDSYGDLEHPYTQLKKSKRMSAIWNHDSYSSFTVYTVNSVIRYQLMHTRDKILGFIPTKTKRVWEKVENRLHT